MSNSTDLKNQIYATLKGAGLKAAITGRSPDNKYAVHRRGYVVGVCFSKPGALTVHFEYE